MLEAIAQNKARQLLDSHGGNTFWGSKRPQEDLITSAIWGRIRLLPPAERFKAIKILFGPSYDTDMQLDTSCELKISLWRRFYGIEGRRYIEPDVLLSCGKNAVLVEMKWNASLSKNQIEQQIEAVKHDGYNVKAAVLLGAKKQDDDTSFNEVSILKRTWREVSADLQFAKGEKSSALRIWAETLQTALQNTSIGRVFSGLCASVCAEPVAAVNYRFVSASRPPWHKDCFIDVPLSKFRFDRRAK